MSEIQNALDALQSLMALMPTPPAPSMDRAMAKALARLGQQSARAVIPPIDKLDALRRHLRTNFLLQGSSSLTLAQWRLVPWVLWNGPAPVLATMPGLVEAAIEKAEGHWGTLRSLIGAYFIDFDPNAPKLHMLDWRSSNSFSLPSGCQCNPGAKQRRRTACSTARWLPRALQIVWCAIQHP